MSGIKYNDVIEYWDKRSEKQKELTVGFGGNKNMESQNDEYDEKTNFVVQYLDSELKTIDYGCGTGRWSKFFNNYIGLDITKNLLYIAVENNDNKEFIQLEEPTLNGVTLDTDFNQFFTSTVLQHCDDDLVDKIIESLYKIKPTNLTIVLYENSVVKAPHVNGRKPNVYLKMFGKYYNIKNVESKSHIVHGEEHSIIKMSV